MVTIKDSYLAIIKDEHLMVRKIFQYLVNYMHEHKENDHLDMDFVNAIIIFLDTYLIPIYFKREEQILFEELHKLSIPKNLKLQVKDITHRHLTISNFVKKLSLLRRRYEKGSNSAITEIHSILELLILSFNKLVIEQENFFPKIEKYLSELIKEKIMNKFNKFNENFIKEMIHQRIIEEYKKYDSHL